MTCSLLIFQDERIGIAELTAKLADALKVLLLKTADYRVVSVNRIFHFYLQCHRRRCANASPRAPKISKVISSNDASERRVQSPLK
jgi:hypothetical protein